MLHGDIFFKFPWVGGPGDSLYQYCYDFYFYIKFGAPSEIFSLKIKLIELINKTFLFCLSLVDYFSQFFC